MSLDNLKRKIVSLYLSLLVLLALGCFKSPKVVESQHGLEMQNLSFKVHDIKAIPWKVGNGFRKVVSKGLTFTIDLPELPSSDLDQINMKYGVDSWVIKVSMFKNSRKIELGSSYAPFKRALASTRVNRTSQIRSASFTLSYAASAISERLRSFICPAFSHNWVVDDYQIDGNIDYYSLVVQTNETFNDIPSMVELTPTVLNVGHQLQGEYMFEVGLYRSRDRRLFSRLMTLGQKVFVKSEKQVSIPECAGIHLENEPQKPRSIPLNRR